MYYTSHVLHEVGSASDSQPKRHSLVTAGVLTAAENGVGVTADAQADADPVLLGCEVGSGAVTKTAASSINSQLSMAADRQAGNAQCHLIAEGVPWAPSGVHAHDSVSPVIQAQGHHCDSDNHELSTASAADDKEGTVIVLEGSGLPGLASYLSDSDR